MNKSIPFTLLVLLISVYSLFSQSAGQAKYETDDYEITFPKQFEKSAQPVASSLGQLTLTIISYEPGSLVNDSNYVYSIMESKYPDSTIHSDRTDLLDDFFKSSINGAVKNLNGKLIKETKGLTGKYPNRTIEIDFQDGLAIIKMTMILRESKMIIIQTITDTQKYPNSSVMNFLESFKLK